MLPTLVFILWAYGMYALICTLSGRKGSALRPRSPWRRFGWLGLLAGAGVGLGLVLILAQSFKEPDHNLKLTGFLGTVWAEGWPDHFEGRVEFPPIKSQDSGNHPAYVLLHPSTPPLELTREKTAPRPRPGRKPKVSKAVPQRSKSAKAAKNKVKTTAKNKVKTSKKKKPSTSMAGKKQSSG